jgi:hypothetical protein
MDETTFTGKGASLSENRERQPSEIHIETLEALTIDERAAVINAIRASEAAYGYRIEHHFCFRNSQILTLADHELEGGSSSLRYFEGHIVSNEGAVPHAWIEINGKIVDATLMCSPQGLRVLTKTQYYFKKEVPLEYVRDYFEFASRYGQYGSIRRLTLIPQDQITGEAIAAQQREITPWWKQRS